MDLLILSILAEVAFGIIWVALIEPPWPKPIRAEQESWPDYEMPR